MFAVEVQNLKKIYQISEQNQLSALDGVSFQIKHGECVGIVGESGSGKSTLLHILGTLDTHTSGKMQIDGKNPFLGTDKQISQFRNQHLGFVFQNNNLLPEFSALENVMLPGLIAQAPFQDVKEKAAQLLERVGLAKRMAHFPSQLSGGEQQRVAIARALVNQPVLLLADEPTGNLDSKNAHQIHNLLLEVNATFRATVLIVTHNKDFASTLPRRIHLRDGKIEKDDGSLA